MSHLFLLVSDQIIISCDVKDFLIVTQVFVAFITVWILGWFFYIVFGLKIVYHL